MKYSKEHVTESTSRTDDTSENIFKIIKEGNETKIRIFTIVEVFRFAYLLYFSLIMVLVVSITSAFVKEGFKEIMTSLTGFINICSYFDFPPTTYVVPSFYAIFPTIVFLYAITFVFRAWISCKENKISQASLILYMCVYLYLFLSAAFFATTFAIQPSLDDLPKTYILHTAPFTNLIISFNLVQIAATIFNNKVAWIDWNVSVFLKISSYSVTTILTLSSIVKVLWSINTFGGVIQTGNKEKVIANGWIWNVQEEPFGKIGQTNDTIFMICTFVYPMCEAIYLMLKKSDAHGVIFTIEDNKMAKSGMDEESSRLLSQEASPE